MLEILLITIITITLLGTVRTISFKTIQERMVGLDILTTVTAGLLIVLTVIFDKAFLLDITMVYAILSFAAVILIARYLEGGI